MAIFFAGVGVGVIVTAMLIIFYCMLIISGRASQEERMNQENKGTST